MSRFTEDRALLTDDMRGLFYVGWKDLRAYYLKPPNISWGILLPFAFVLAFAMRNPSDLRALVPGLLGLTLLFGTSSMEAIVITFERRIGAFERLLLAPVRLPALLAGKMLGGMVFGLTVTAVVLAIALIAFGAGSVDWPLLTLTLLLSAAAFAALGAFVSVSVKEVFEAQTLANFIRFPMIFLGGVFVPVASLPVALQVAARVLPLTYSVEALHTALGQPTLIQPALDLVALLAFTVGLFLATVRILAQRLA
jgi:ABC-2 type transport system permease protein